MSPAATIELPWWQGTIGCWQQCSLISCFLDIVLTELTEHADQTKGIRSVAQELVRSIARRGVKSAARSGLYLAVGVLPIIVLGATGIAAHLLEASPSSKPAPARFVTSTATNAAGVSSEAGASSTRTLYSYGGQLRPLVEETNGVQTLNIYGPDGQIIAQVARDGQGGREVRHLLADHLGSTRVALDADGNVVARFEYGPYGETAASGTAAADVRYRYTGHPYDEPQGLYETPARQYDPTLGRFLSVDPQREDASPYAYAGNNPVGLVDPTGGTPGPFFIVSDRAASDRLPFTEGIYELFNRPRSGDNRGLTTYSDLARVAGHGSALEAWPDARPILQQDVEGTGNRRSVYIFLDALSTPDDVHNIAEGMSRLDYLSGEAGGPHGSLFGDITIIGQDAGWEHSESLFTSLSERGYPSVRAFQQRFYTEVPNARQPPGAVSEVAFVRVNDPILMRNGSEGVRTSRVPPAVYRNIMGLAPPHELGPRTVNPEGGYRRYSLRPLEPQLQTRPESSPRLNIQVPSEPIVPNVEGFGFE